MCSMRLHGILSRDDFPLDLKTATIMEYITPFLYLLNTMAPYLLLGFLLAGVIHAYVPRRLYARYLSQPDFRSVALAALFGVPLPLCSVRRDSHGDVAAARGGVEGCRDVVSDRHAADRRRFDRGDLLGTGSSLRRDPARRGARDGAGGRVDGQSADPQRDRRYPSRRRKAARFVAAAAGSWRRCAMDSWI